MAKVLDVANYIIDALPVDNLKLQKLLYYSQAVHMVLNDGEQLFSDNIEAWQYGPVVVCVYRKYKRYGFDTIKQPKQPAIKSKLTPSEILSIDMVLQYYGGMSGVELIAKTHQESPWVDAYVPNVLHTVISPDAILQYFKANLKFDDR